MIAVQIADTFILKQDCGKQAFSVRNLLIWLLGFIAYRLLMEGRTMRSIFEEHGIASEILGDKRIWSFAHKLRTIADRDEGFADLRKDNTRKPASQTREQTLAARVEQLEHELAYTRQEVEFLKKIHTADLEARKSWESRLRQK